MKIWNGKLDKIAGGIFEIEDLCFGGLFFIKIERLNIRQNNFEN